MKIENPIQTKSENPCPACGAHAWREYFINDSGIEGTFGCDPIVDLPDYALRARTARIEVTTSPTMIVDECVVCGAVVSF